VRVFVTGGTGLIGSHVAERLRRRGDEVVAMVRAASDTTHLEAIGCSLVTGEVMNPPETTAGPMRGCDAVVHAAAVVFRSVSRAEYLRVNVEGTERVLRAAGMAAPRVVHVSSVAVYAGLPMETPLTELRWLEADPGRQNAYAASKHLSERAAWRLHDAGSIRLTSVRPSVVYGERDRAATPVLVRWASMPVIPLPGGGRTELPLVYAGNVAAAVVSALDREAAVGRAYNTARDHPITGRELFTRAAEGLGRRPRILPIPVAPLVALGATIEAVTRRLPGVRTRDLLRGVRSLTRDNPYDSSRARLELGWSGLVDHAEGVRRTLEWWRRGGGGAAA
jgi:nucleoside-diphosphate-sugar epimerase